MKRLEKIQDDSKGLVLRRWRIMEAVLQNGMRSRHVFGHDITNNIYRASSPIREFDFAAMTVVTRSGSIYKLIGLPEYSSKADDAWRTWSRTNGVVSEEDVTDEFFNFAKRPDAPVHNDLQPDANNSDAKNPDAKDKIKAGSTGVSTGYFSSFRSEVSRDVKIGGGVHFTDAINAHVRCKKRLQDYLDGTLQEQLDPTVVCRDDRCALGQWIHNPAYKHLHIGATFHQLRSDHAQFHIVAGKIVAHVQANESASAYALLNGELKYISREVVKLLAELGERVQVSR